MVYGLLKQISSKCPNNERLLGLDIGKKTIGVALCNSDQTIATPLTTIKRSKFISDLKALKKIIDDYQINGMVLGFPVNMDGSKSGSCDRVESFADEFIKQYDGNMWIALWDERLSTVSVEEYVDQFVEKRKNKINAKSSGLIDKLAAQVILQSALDYLTHTRNA